MGTLKTSKGVPPCSRDEEFFLNFLPTGSSFSLKYIDPSLLVKEIRAMDTSLKGSISAIPDKVVKASIHYLAVPVAFIFNLSIYTSTCPNDFKVAEVVPIYKGKGSRSEPGNYRPISLTVLLAKLFERCIKLQLTDFLNSLNFFSDHQHGFLENRSTETALCDIMEFVLCGCAGGNAVLGVFLDVSKAFDCVSFVILEKIFGHIGFTDKTINWFSSLIQNRDILVKASGFSSSRKKDEDWNRTGFRSRTVLFYNIFKCPSENCE